MKMKKIIAVAIAGIFLIGFFVAAKPVIAASLEEIQNQLQSLLNQVNRLQLEVDNRQKANAESILPAFNMTVRWGNVIDKATAEGKKAANFNGSVEIQGGGNINVSSSRFEGGDNDRIVSRTSTKVLWRSTTHGGWDGVKVQINNALPTDTLIIGTAQGTTTKTAQELYDLTSPFSQGVGEEREIVVGGTPKIISLPPSSLTTLTASPNPCTITSPATTCSTTISWTNSPATARTHIFIDNTNDSNAETLFAAGVNRSSVASWITAPPNEYVFNMYDCTNVVCGDKPNFDPNNKGPLLGSVSVKAKVVTDLSSSSSSANHSSSSSSISQGSSSSAGSSSLSSSSASSVDGSSSSSSSSSQGSSSSASSSSHHVPQLHFNMTVRWGNVIDKATAEGKKAANFNGSVEIQGGGNISVSSSLFESGDNDRIISRTPAKVSWKSTTHGGWDGVKVRINNAMPTDTVVIGTAQGTTTMTAQELYDLTSPSIQSAGEGREIVIEGTPNMKLLNFNMTVRWGNVIDKATAEGKKAANFNGSVEIPDITISSIKKTEVKLIGGLRLERGKSQYDKVFRDANKIIWKSTTYGGWDGVKIRMRNVFPTDNVVIGTAQGTTTMTAQELYDLTSPSIQDVGNGREIVINGTPKTRSDRFLSSSSSSSSSLQGSSSSASSSSSSSSSASSADGSSSSSSSSLSSSSSVSSASSSSVSNSSSTSSAQ